MMEGCKNVTDLCNEVGIELQGEEGHPFHCDERMQTKSGIIGTDFARCLKCKLTIGNMLSPHINGGYVFDDEKMLTDKETWRRIVLQGDKEIT
jgi:hypothetical protein